METQDVSKKLMRAFQYSCEAQSMKAIQKGRTEILKLPRRWVLKSIHQIAKSSLNLNDEWEYRRLLEVYESLDKNLLNSLIERGLTHSNPEIKEAALDFKERREEIKRREHDRKK